MDSVDLDGQSMIIERTASKIERTKNMYGHLFAHDRTSILDAMNQAVSRLHAYEDAVGDAGEGHEAA